MINTEIELFVARLNCGNEKATAFLISPNKVITATHAIEPYFSENAGIKLEFLNISNKPIKRSAIPVGGIECNTGLAVTILEFKRPIDIKCLEFTDYILEKDEECEAFGYPAVKRVTGHRSKVTVARRISESMTQCFDWDLDLDHNNSKIDDFSGYSGSPLIVFGKIAGVVIAESNANGKAISIGAISVAKFKNILDELNIKITTIADQMTNIIHDKEDVEYDDYTFIKKLESANIFEHEMCQEEFYNAEIFKSAIDSKKVEQEIQDYDQLKKNIKSVWHTKFLSYEDEIDGNKLLSSVYERIEDLNSSLLNTSNLTSIYVKKGILHQWSQQCKVGWVKNYKRRLEQYNESKDGSS